MDWSEFDQEQLKEELETLKSMIHTKKEEVAQFKKRLRNALAEYAKRYKKPLSVAEKARYIQNTSEYEDLQEAQSFLAFLMKEQSRCQTSLDNIIQAKRHATMNQKRAWIAETTSRYADSVDLKEVEETNKRMYKAQRRIRQVGRTMDQPMLVEADDRSVSDEEPDLSEFLEEEEEAPAQVAPLTEVNVQQLPSIPPQQRMEDAISENARSIADLIREFDQTEQSLNLA